MEQQYLHQLRDYYRCDSQRVKVPIGDDAAVVSHTTGTELVITTDLIADGTHFRLEEVSPELIGRKALAVNLSDLAAMGATATGATVALLLPRGRQSLDLATRIGSGIRQLADEFHVDIVGGDTNTWDGRLAVSVTALGSVRTGAAWLRSTAQPGDRIVVTGQLGGSLLGHHLHFTPRLAVAAWLRTHYAIRAAMDLSDGLSLDLSRMAEASQCGAVLDLSQIPISADAFVRSEQDGLAPLEHALSDGEDFELLLAVPPDLAERLVRDRDAPVPFTDIGCFIADQGLWSLSANQRTAITPQGFLHGS